MKLGGPLRIGIFKCLELSHWCKHGAHKICLWNSLYCNCGRQEELAAWSWLGQRHFINCIPRFFSICSHSWDSVVLPSNMYGMWMAIVFPRCCKVSFFKVLTLLITPRVEVRERKGGAIRKVIVQKEQVELKTIDFSLSLHKSSKLNTCSPFLSLFSQLVFYSIWSMFISFPRVLHSLFAWLESIYQGK